MIGRDSSNAPKQKLILSQNKYMNVYKYLLLMALANSLHAAVQLVWQDNANNETGFRVERSNDNVTWLVLGQLPVNSQAYQDTTTEVSTRYYYRVAAFSAAGSSGFATSEVTTPSDSEILIISEVTNTTTPAGTSTGNIPFTVTGDGTITVTGTSSNQSLVPDQNVVLSGTGTDRTVNVTPVIQPNQATITIRAQDSQGTATEAFTITIGQSSSQTFSKLTPITIPDVGAATPYPSVIPVAGMVGTIKDIVVRLNGIRQTYLGDVDVLLVGPDGKKAMIFSDVGSDSKPTNLNVALTDGAANSIGNGPIQAGTYKPTDLSPNEERDILPSPAPQRPYTSSLSQFYGTNPNGDWMLYVQDDGAGDLGSIAQGWSITITSN